MIAINGRIFEFVKTGVGRFCYEVIKQLDAKCNPREFCLLVSKKAKGIPQLNNIECICIGASDGIFWEQIELPIYMKIHRMVGLNMSNSGPISKPDYVVIHDIQLLIYKNETKGISEKIKIQWPLLQYRFFAKKARHIFTVSVFQKNEIMRLYNVDSKKISVVYNGWQHMDKIAEVDGTFLEKKGLMAGDFFFAISTRTKNKNFKWIYEIAKRNKHMIFVIAGKVDSKYLEDDINLDDATNLICLGYVSDEEVKCLMRNCRAFLYPSLYEGFGIPPLEALSVGAPAVISNTSCLPEIYGNSVHYINPTDFDVNLDNLLEEKVSCPESILNRYSWERTADMILNKIRMDIQTGE